MIYIFLYHSIFYMGIETNIAEQLWKNIEVDLKNPKITNEELTAIREALRKDRNAVIALAKSWEGELRDFLMREYYYMSEREVGKEGIKAFQKAMWLSADGVYGPKTFEAIIHFQAHNGLKVDGIIGKTTLEKITGKRQKWTQWASSEGEKTYNYSSKALSYLETKYSPEQIQTIVKMLNWVLPKEYKLKKNATGENIVQAIALFQKVHGGLTVDGILGKKTLQALNEDINAWRSTPMSESEIGKAGKKMDRVDTAGNLEIPRKWGVIFKEFFLHAKSKQEQNEILSGKYPIALADIRQKKWIIIMGKETIEFPMSFAKNGKIKKGPTEWDNATNYGFIEHFTKWRPYKYGWMAIESIEATTMYKGFKEPNVKWWHASPGKWPNWLRNTIWCKGLPNDVAAKLAKYVNKNGKWYWYASLT